MVVVLVSDSTDEQSAIWPPTLGETKDRGDSVGFWLGADRRTVPGRRDGWNPELAPLAPGLRGRSGRDYAGLGLVAAGLHRSDFWQIGRFA